jgi:hypothetical protein
MEELEKWLCEIFATHISTFHSTQAACMWYNKKQPEYEKQGKYKYMKETNSNEV